MNTMNIFAVHSLLLIATFVNIYAMEEGVPQIPMERLSLTEKFLKRIISPQEYLFFIENNPVTWGHFSRMVRSLRVADYSNYSGSLYVYKSLYQELLNNLATIQGPGMTITFLISKLSSIQNSIRYFYRKFVKGLREGIIEEGNVGG